MSEETAAESEEKRRDQAGDSYRDDRKAAECQNTIVLPSATGGGDLWQRSFGICAGKMVSPEDTKRGTLNSYQSCRPRSWLYLVHERRSV